MSERAVTVVLPDAGPPETAGQCIRRLVGSKVRLIDQPHPVSYPRYHPDDVAAMNRELAKHDLCVRGEYPEPLRVEAL